MPKVDLPLADSLDEAGRAKRMEYDRPISAAPPAA
jgi:hypothetical protein